ncbi:cytochrome P450 2G1-like [Ambystoma mexicanum]|uniref:cytochrome P450 2G1-like n=1 Tax=Ambystoma mexicanum TaxID=8296 RepID=UPI0037E73392
MDFGGADFLCLIVTLACLIFFIAWKRLSRHGNLPPGPVPWPLLGNMLQLKGQPIARTFMKLSGKYGPVFTVYMGPKPTIVLCSYEAIKEALVDQGDIFIDRAHMPALQMFNKGYGIIVSSGERWKQLHRFSLKALRTFGMGKSSLEKQIQEEARFLVEEFRKTKELPYDPTCVIRKAVSNIICSMVFGHRFDYNDRTFLTLIQLFNESFSFMTCAWAWLLDFFPNILHHLPGPQQRFLQNAKTIRRIVKNIVKEHRETLDPACPRDFIDCFLIKMEEERQNPSTEFVMKNLVATTNNLFAGGTESVSVTLKYGLLIFMKHQDVQERIHEEIDDVIGMDRRPSLEDRTKMPYTEAVIHEIQRFINIGPIGVPRCLTSDTMLRGYYIPKGTNVLPIFTAAHCDQKYFQNPECFDPKNFLDVNGGFTKNDAFLPFSIGKRSCLGEGLARMELFLFFTTIMQNFTIKSVGPPEEIDLSPQISSIMNLPRSYQLQLLPRLS